MLILGIDVGTTGTKAIVIDEKGSILGYGYKGYKINTKNGGIVEQNPEDWYSACCHAVKKAVMNVDKLEITALSLSTQGASSLPVDEDFMPLMNAITWMDRRASAEADDMSRNLGDDYIYKKTGFKANPSLDAAKIMWLKRNKPELYEKMSCFISTLEFMNYRLAGINAIDPTNSAIRQLVDINTGEYDERILGFTGADIEKLPPIKKSGEYLGKLTQRAAEDLGLHMNVRVYNGAHDQYCGLYGADIVREGELMLSTGTAWVLLGVSDKPYYTDSYIASGPHIIKNRYGILSSLPVAGAAFDWLAKNIISEDYVIIDENVKDRMYKCKDLLFYPYLTGIHFPRWDENAKGTLTGLTLDNDKYDLALSCMEGIVFHIGLMLEEYPKVRKIKVMGGATRSTTWMDILSAVSSCDIEVMNQKDIPCIGAAIIAAVGEGLDYDSLTKALTSGRKYSCSEKKMVKHYSEKYEKFKKGMDFLEIYRR